MVLDYLHIVSNALLVGDCQDILVLSQGQLVLATMIDLADIRIKAFFGYLLVLNVFVQFIMRRVEHLMVDF